MIKPLDGLEIGTNLNSLKKCLSSNATISSNSSISQYSNSYKLSQSLNQALQSISHAKTRLNTRVSKSPNLEKSAAEINETLNLYNSQDTKSIVDSKSTKTTINGNKNNQKKSINSYGSSTKQRYQRTTSESSNESNYNYLNTNSNTKHFKSLMHYKPGLFNNLKKLNNEKLVLVSDSSPVGIFSRIPFRMSTYKLDFCLKVKNLCFFFFKYINLI